MKIKEIYVRIFAYVLGLVIVLTILSQSIDSNYLVKYDYVLQHLLFYKEFYRLLQNGLPFWSWNSFLGLNFWASKAYYLIGDPYAWLGSLMNDPVNHVAEILSQLLRLKFLVAYTSFYLLSSQWKAKPIYSLLLSMIYVFSGWNLVFLEHPMYTSFYSVLPLLFYGLERYLKTKQGFWTIISVALLVSINFYLFWVVSILVLIYWIFHWIYQSEEGWLSFLKHSILLLYYYLIGVAIATLIWYPSILHLLQSQRLGNSLDTYTKWSDVNIASFLLFSIVPMLKYLDGVFKDYWYYFNQVGLYISLLAWFVVPQALWSSQNKREFFSTLGLLILSIVLLASPQFGLVFHFTYSIRYTLVETFIGLLLLSKAFKRVNAWKWWSIVGSELLFLSIYALIKKVYIPEIHPILPTHIEELTLLDNALTLSYAYTLLFLMWIIIQKTKFKKFTLIFSALVLVVLTLELNQTTKAALLSQKNEWDLPYDNPNFQKALTFIQAQDTGFYRIFTDFSSYSNISLDYGFMSNATYDTTYEYSLTSFLHWTRQYPETNWEFRYSDPTLTSTLGIKYAIVRSISVDNPMTDPWFADEIGSDYDFGEFHVLKYKDPTSFATTYSLISNEDEINQLDIESTEYRINELAGKLKRTLYVDESLLDKYNLTPSTSISLDPTRFEDNHVEFTFETSSDSFMLLRMPFDKGWSAMDNGNSIETYSVQGGFLGLYIPTGSHQLVLDFIPEGFELGKKISILALIFAFIMEGLHLAYRTFKRLKPDSVKTSSEQRNASE